MIRFWRSVFLDHPHKEGMTYLQHLRRAWGFAWSMGKGSAALFMHGVFPKTFEYTGTNIIKDLHNKLHR